MSLASRLANILFPNQTTSLASSDGVTEIAFGDGPHSTNAHTNARKTGKHTESTTMEEEEEEGRPPYIHVHQETLSC